MSHAHPLRHFVFALDRSDPSAWYALRVFKTMQMNAWTIVFPALERLMIRAVRRYAHPTGESARRMEWFMAQEAQHARAHDHSLSALEAHGFRLGTARKVTSFLVEGILERGGRLLGSMLGPASVLSIFACAEHWTERIAVGELLGIPEGVIIPEMVRLYLWHGVEEIEHRSVVFDLFREAGGGYAMRLLGFLVGTLGFILLSGVAMACILGQGPRVMGTSIATFTADFLSDLWSARAGFGWYVSSAILYLRPGFHPDQDELAEPCRERALALIGPSLG